MTVDQTDGVHNDKQSKGNNKTEDGATGHKSTRKSDAAADKPSGSGEVVAPRTGTFTRSRVIKKPKRDLSPIESPVKKNGS